MIGGFGRGSPMDRKKPLSPKFELVLFPAEFEPKCIKMQNWVSGGVIFTVGDSLNTLYFFFTFFISSEQYPGIVFFSSRQILGLFGLQNSYHIAQNNGFVCTKHMAAPLVQTQMEATVYFWTKFLNTQQYEHRPYNTVKIREKISKFFNYFLKNGTKTRAYRPASQFFAKVGKNPGLSGELRVCVACFHVRQWLRDHT